MASTVKLSITLPRELVETLRERTKPGELSAYIAAAVEQQVAMDGLDEIIAAGEAVHGPISDEAIEEKLEILRRAQREQSGNSSTAA